MKMVKQHLILFFALFTSSVSFNVNALADGASELSTLLKNYQTLSGNFNQQLIGENGEVIQESSGELVIKKPGFFHWETKDPFPQLVVSNLQNIWLYDPDLEQVTIRSFSNAFDDSPALLLSGDDKKIRERYKIEKLSDKAFVLTPVDNSKSAFTELELTFENDMLSRMVLKDTIQQTTIFSFSSLSLNIPFSEKFFDFYPPEGVDILVDD
jgi:outer membrane lipoprotein carrier protein